MENSLSHLRQLITDHCNLEELRTLCFDLGVNYDELGGEGLGAKARELLAYLDRRDRIPELIATGRHQRPDIAGWAQAQLDLDMEQLRTRRDQTDQARRAMRERQRVVNLRPQDVTHTFKDRQREIRALRDYLADPTVRLVNIVGRAGMGKTALACRVLADLERGVLPVPDQDEKLLIDGILYLSARGTGLSLERIYADVGRMLGEPVASNLAVRWASKDTPLVAKVDYLLENLESGLYLFLLDNLEDELAEDGAVQEEGLRLFIERCLTMPGGARLIATSRKQVQVAPAALRRMRRILLQEGLPEDEAVALLRELDSQGTLGLREAMDKDLRQAAQRTQGIPRALELLAGILHQDPATSLSQLLADEDLFGEQVVERLVAQSHERLDESEKRVMEALAVFDRPVEETAVVFLLHPWFPSVDVRASLRRLVGGYFVSASRVTGEYSLHPLDQGHAYRQLPGDEESDVYNRRNLELRAAEFYASIRKPQSEWTSIDDLAPQLAEFEHRFRAQDYDGACLVLDPIDFDYLHLWGHYARLVELRKKLQNCLASPILKATNLGNLGLAYHALGEFEQAIDCYQRSLAISRETGDRKNEGVWLGHLGRTYRYLGKVEQAILLYRKALSIAQEVCDRKSENIWLGNLGMAHHDLGQIEDASRHYSQALEISREMGDRRKEGTILGYLGNVQRALGNSDQARKLYEEALEISSEIDDHRAQSNRLGNLGLINLILKPNRVEEAIEFHIQALEIAQRMGNRLGESYQLLWLGKALLASGRFDEAQRHFEDALALDIPETRYQASLALGVAFQNLRDDNARSAFVGTKSLCRAMLKKTARLYGPRYALATALAGQAVCNPHWTEKSKKTRLLAPALTEYRRALENCDAPGIVGDALRDLELIRAAGIEGLEPIVELLESAIKDD